MIHTRKDLLSEALRQCIRSEHKCCVDKAMEDWANLFTSAEHREFFYGLIQKTVEESESPLDALVQVSVMCLALGSVCGLGMIPQLMTKLPEEIERRMRQMVKQGKGEIH